MVIMPREPWLQKRYYDTSPGQAALSRFLPLAEAGIAEDLVFRTRAKFRFIAGIRRRTSTNTVFTSVYGVHYPPGSPICLDYCSNALYLFRPNYDLALFIKPDRCECVETARESVVIIAVAVKRRRLISHYLSSY